MGPGGGQGKERAREGDWRRGIRGVGDGRAEGLSAIGDGGRGAMSLTPDVVSTGSCLLDSILSTLLKKRSGDV